jgi:hypothetical protein
MIPARIASLFSRASSLLALVDDPLMDEDQKKRKLKEASRRATSKLQASGAPNLQSLGAMKGSGAGLLGKGY